MAAQPPTPDAEDRAATLRELLKTVSHDLRNPLAAVVTNLEFAARLLARLDAHSDLSEAVQDSVRACEVLQRIVSNLEVIARFPALDPTLNLVRVGDSVLAVIKRCEGRAAQAGIELIPSDDLTEDRWKLDRWLFELVLENLIADGLQYAPRGSVIHVDVALGDAELRVAMRDQGGAIEPDARSRVLTADAHTPQGRRTAMRQGRGLALLVASYGAQVLGGQIEVDGEGDASSLALVVPRAVTPG